MNRKQIESFTSPGNDYRSAPFWAWNGKLDPEELRRQICIMHRMGLGGFFMHSRVGLDTPYLSKEWFDCVNACVDEADWKVTQSKCANLVLDDRGVARIAGSKHINSCPAA